MLYGRVEQGLAVKFPEGTFFAWHVLPSACEVMAHGCIQAAALEIAWTCGLIHGQKVLACVLGTRETIWILQ
jgi:hypothetical protein